MSLAIHQQTPGKRPKTGEKEKYGQEAGERNALKRVEGAA